MDAFRLCLALGPVAVYMLVFGVINLSRRPFLVSGTRDAAALGLALVGFVMIGPIELFFPDTASIRFGPYVWVLLVALYILCLVLFLLTLRPRLIIYNISGDKLRPILADLVGQLDSDARWAGDSLALPTLDVQLHVESQPGMRNVSLVSSGPKQSHAGWRKLELSLQEVLSQFEVSRNPRGASLVSVGLMMMVFLIWVIDRTPEAVPQSLADMFQL